MTAQNPFHLSSSAAEAYESQKVPAMFGPLAEATLKAIDVPRRADVLDVACGTGAVARAVSKRLIDPSHIVGTDLNPSMIEIAQRKEPAGPHTFEWLVAAAQSQPFENGTFDLAFCQQGLQFFPDRPAALSEIRRVLRPGGRFILTGWAAISPFLQITADILERHLGADAAKKALAPFAFRDGEQIHQLIADAGFETPKPRPLEVVRRLSASPEAMREELLATPNEAALRALPGADFDAIVSKILAGLDHFRDGNTLALPQQTHLFDAVAA